MSAPEIQTIAGYKVYEVSEIDQCVGCKFDIGPNKCGYTPQGQKHCVINETIFIEATLEALAEYALTKE
jgi:mannose-6-phosphate isomerase-like protein (cupin superfamily)